tara:strand:- start:3042 stop:4889 length:1848 start_codon:yes stop_codon:yes gene_type:complete
MKDNIISIDLGTETAPQVREVFGQNYIEYGTEEWKNLYPQFLIDLYYNSSTNAAIINATSEMIAAEDLVIDDEHDNERNLEAIVKLKQFMNQANGNESLHEVIKKVAFDFKLQGAFAINIIWSQDRTEIAEIYHIPVEKIRAEKPDEMGKVCGYFVSADWTDIRNNPPHRVPAFNVNDRTAPNQILYSGLYSPNMSAYFTPDYLAGNNWSLIDQKVAEFHLNNIKNGFSGSYFISFANGVPSQEERFQIEQSLTDKFTGSQNAGKFILTFSDDKTRTPEITPVSVADQDKLFLSLQELLVQNILTAHRCTSPMLMGIKSDTGLGNNADELNSASNFYLNTVVKPFQDHIVKVLRKIFNVNNMDMPVSFVQLKPITLEFTSEDLKGIMTEDELRSEMGLKPLDVEIREDFSKVEKTCLDTFLEGIEDIPEDWELIHSEEVDGEHRDFDFEKALNDIANNKIELASTGTARPNARSTQDGVNKSYNEFFKVRYIYIEDESLTNKSKTSREFCKKMEAADKIYRKEDIQQMAALPVNPGFGIDGANTYDILLYKGGPQCFHYWERRIYRTSLRRAKGDLRSTDIITEAQAESDGFTLEQENDLVMIPPRKMVNNGYYN